MFNKIISIALFSLLLIAGTALAGGEAGKFGIGFAVTESTPTFMGSLWVSNSFTLEPSFAISIFSRDKDHTATQLMPGFGIIYHMSRGKDTRPFVGVRAMFNTLLSSGDTYSDIYIGPAFGITHFFSKQFAVSGEYQINIISTNDNYSPSQLAPGFTYLQTASMLRLHLYF